MPVCKRDRVWKAAVELLTQVESDTDHGLTNQYGSPGFTAGDVAERIDGEVADRTIRDCLSAMVELDLLAVRPSRPHYYRLPRKLRDTEADEEEMVELLARLA